MRDQLEIITGLAQSTGIDNQADKGQYLQYNKNGDINTEISIQLMQIKTILDLDFENKGIEAYLEQRFIYLINYYIKKNNIIKEFEEYGFSNNISCYPKNDLLELLKQDNIDIIDILDMPEINQIKFYIGGSEIYIKGEAYKELMANN